MSVGKTSAGVTLNLDGYTELPPGLVATVVTYLEMRVPPAAGAEAVPLPGAALVRLGAADEPRYAAIYRSLGERWMWFSRLALSAADRAAIIGDPAVEAYALVLNGADAGLLELDFRVAGEAELAFFGLYESAIGTGAAQWLIQAALARAFAAKDVRRLWLHTCTLDHPRALAFYRCSGFTPYKIALEIMPDPRLAGLLPRDAAAHVPVYE